VNSVEEFERFCKVCTRTLLEYKNGSTPRTSVSGNVYTTTEFPADRYIPMHNEMSYTTTWPLKAWFYCVLPSLTGGQTPLADAVKVYNKLRPSTVAKFAEKGVLYVRNYGEGFDVPWQKVFMTDDRKVVEEFCAASNIQVEWLEGDRLRTRERCQGVAKHWATGHPIFMNQAYLFNIHALGKEEEKAMRSAFKRDDIPRNSYYGDGEEIEPEVLDEIARVYDECHVAFPWQTGDIAMVDNMRVMHGRYPFTGPRRICVAMAEPYSAPRD
jgi:alpha-ketoglutarate-dependent taurine dioxygenase